jgi:hypothetical protein
VSRQQSQAGRPDSPLPASQLFFYIFLHFFLSQLARIRFNFDILGLIDGRLLFPQSRVSDPDSVRSGDPDSDPGGQK